MTRRRTLRALAALLLVGLLVLAGLRLWSARAARSAAAPVASTPALELQASDLVRAETRILSVGQPISGVVRSARSAVVKARVPGELQDLTVREGDSVRAGQVLARIQSTEYGDRLRQARQQAEAAQAQVAIAQRQYDNNLALVNQGFISRTALDTSQAQLDAAKANQRAAQAATDVVAQSVRDTQLVAPIGGQVAARLAQPGERVGVEARIVEIVDLTELELEAALSPADAVAVRTGQRAELNTEGVPEPVVAEVVRINPSVQAASRSVLVYLRLQPQRGLRHGLFAQGRILTDPQRVRAVPLSAVRTDQPLPYVQLVQQGRVAHRSVRTGLRGLLGDETLVAVEGVDEGAWVLRGSVGLQAAGTPVRLPADAAQPAASAAADQPAR